MDGVSEDANVLDCRGVMLVIGRRLELDLEV